MNDTENIIDNYVNGNLEYVKHCVECGGFQISELLEYYIEFYNPSKDDIILFVRRVEP